MDIKKTLYLFMLISTGLLIILIGKATRETRNPVSILVNEADVYKAQKSQASHIFVNNVGEIVIPEASVLQTLDGEVLQEIYHRYIQNIQVRCRRQLHLGNERDGGYHVCEDSEVVPTPPCLVYSFGVSRDFSFDDSVAAKFGCEVHSFDPADGQEDHQHSVNVTFHKLGIGGQNKDTGDGLKLRTLGAIRSMLGHEKRHINILKIDTEGAEWPSIPEIVKSGSIDDVRQLIVEFHVFTTFSWIDLTSPQDYLAHLILLRGLYERGFRMYYFRMWTSAANVEIFMNKAGTKRTGCHEVHFIRGIDIVQMRQILFGLTILIANRRMKMGFYSAEGARLRLKKSMSQFLRLTLKPRPFIG